MSVMDRRRALMNVGNKSGSIKTETGVISISSYEKEYISHNLGTQKLFGMIWLEPNEDNEVITKLGYQTIFSTFVTWNRLNEIYNTETKLISNYTTATTKEALYPGNYYMGAGAVLNSAWSNANAAWRKSGGLLTGTAIDDSTIKIYFIGDSGPYTTGTYRWQLWALE